MAGSYGNATGGGDGQLLRNTDFAAIVDNLGDAYETVTEMYGMIWFLADVLSRHTFSSAEELVGDAAQHYRMGLSVSPGVNGALPCEPDHE